MTNSDISFSENEKTFIRSRITDDVSKLILNPPKEFASRAKEIAEQIKSRQKIKKKLPKWYENDQLVMPPPLSTEQSSSNQAASYKAELIKGKRLIDLTGGMGVDTITLANRFEETHYVEQSLHLCQVFNHNSKILLDKQIKTHCSSAEAFLQSFDNSATFFIDPARRDDADKKVFHFENCSPNIIEMLPLLEQKADQVLIKAAPMIDISLGIKQLQFVREVHVVSLRNELKEVLFLLDFQAQQEAVINCINLESDQPNLEFTLGEEKSQLCNFGAPELYLFDPNAAILKAGAFKSIASKYGLTKIAPNTHLYTANKIIHNFPGRVFEVVQSNLTKKNIKTLLPEGKANVMTKNYPQKPEEIRKKLKVKDGGDRFLIGLRDSHNHPSLITAKLI